MLYNGVELPDIESVWTGELKETHPYAYLVRVDIEDSGESIHLYYLLLSDTRGYCVPDIGYWMIPTGSKVATYTLVDGTSEYVLESSEESTEIFTPLYYPKDLVGESNVVECKWCSVDICDQNDSTIVYLSASDPIPVGGTSDLYPVYRMKNGKWVKLTAYRRENGQWVLISKAEESGVYDDTWPIEWNGDTTGRVIVSAPTFAVVFVKVSNLTPSISDLTGGTVEVFSEGATETIQVDAVGVGSYFEDTIAVGELAMIALKDGVSYSTFVFPEKGIYFIAQDSENYVSKLEIPL